MDIEHIGRVEGVKGDKLRVNFISHASCASCQLRGVCSVSDIKEKYVDAEIPGFDVKEGEDVNIVLKSSLGLRAVLLAYILPLVVLFTALFVFRAVFDSEAIGGLLGIVFTAVYYIVLYFKRDKLDKQFNFIIKKIV